MQLAKGGLGAGGSLGAAGPAGRGMNVLMLCNYPLSSSEITGGTSSVAYMLVDALSRVDGISVTTFSIVSSVERYQDFVLPTAVRVVRWPRKVRFSGALRYMPEKRAVRRVARQVGADLVHAQSAQIYAFLARQARRPHVFTVHGIRLKELELERGRLGDVRYWHYTRLVRRNYRKADHVVFTNEYTRRQTEGLQAVRTWTIPNAIDESFFELYPHDDPVPGSLLLVGGIRKRKDIISAVEVVGSLNDRGHRIHLQVFGPAEPEYQARVERLIARRDLKTSITIHGLVSDRKRKELYRRADLLLLTSVEETSPIAVAEAMAAGKPVVATDVGGIHEMVDEGVNARLHAPRDIAGLAESVARLVTDRELREKYSRAGHERALRTLSADAVAQATIEVYQAILRDSPVAAHAH
ncbi:MAG: glycosyltransferase family 4 protein [Gemmatimonadota bacterium]